MNLKNPKALGQILVGLGIFFLLRNTGVFGVLPSFLWFLVLLAGGAAFWLSSEGKRPRWQQIVGYAVIGVVAIITSEDFAGTSALAFVGLAFALVYLSNPRNWWAIIPAGIVSSVALMVLVEELFHWEAVALMFLGFAGTFTLLYLLPKHQGGQRWALIPAIVFIAITVFSNDPGGGTPSWLLPFILIGTGSGVLWWWRRSKR